MINGSPSEKHKQFKKFVLLGIAAVPMVIALCFLPAKAFASSRTLTSQADFNSGYYNSTEGESSQGNVQLTPDGTWTAHAWKTPDLTLSDTSPVTSDGNYVYVIPSGDKEFMRYLPSENRWQRLADAPHYAYSGASINYPRTGDYIYAIFGGYQKSFARYSISQNTWTSLPDAPDLMQSGASVVSDGTNVYVVRGTATTDFWKYSPSTNTWSTNVAGPPASIYTGSASVYYNNKIYLLHGNNTNTLYSYDIVGNTWTTLTNAPVTFYDSRNITLRNGFIYVVQAYSTTGFYKYDITHDSWSALAATPQITRYVGAVYNQVDDTIYVFRGNGTYDFWKYNATANTYAGDADLPNTPGNGADLIHYNGKIYFRRGNGSGSLYAYDETAGTWATLTAAPVNFNDDTKGVVAGSNIYYLQGGNATIFYEYTPLNDTWTQLASLPAGANYGASLAYPGSGNYIYATRGGFTTSFLRYSISGNTWDDAGAADLPSPNTYTAYGARLTTDGTNVFSIGGGGVATISKYVIGTNTWTVVNNVPFAPYWGTDAVYYNGNIYVQAGYYKPDFYVYNIVGNTWRRLPDVQTDYAYNVGPYNGGSLASDGAGTLYEIPGQSISQMLTFSISGNNYLASGTWTSGTLDLNYVASFTSLTATTTTPGNSTLTFDTRTSADSVNWSSWQAVTGGAIASSANRYIQIRADFAATSDKTQTPVLSDITINYTGDTNPPSNPTTITAVSKQVGGTALTSGNSYGYTNPYFTFSGASDTQTAVAGYYVYFGTDISGSPVVNGSYQTTNTYTVTASMLTGTYYLRIATRDSAGNVSNPTAAFAYVYSGVSPYSVISATQSADFTGGIFSNMASTSGQIKLATSSGFWLQQRLSVAPGSLSDGSSIAYVASTKKLYVLRGSNTTNFYVYDIASDTWSSLSNTPAAVTVGGQIIEGPSGYLYALKGNSTATFWQYDIVHDTWSDSNAADAPQPVYYGVSMVYDGSRYIYALKGNSDDTFMRYDTLTDSWYLLANTDFGAPEKRNNNLVYAGGDLTYDSNDTIYAIQGNTYTGFSSYNITSGTWTVLPDLPALPYTGAAIAYDRGTNAVYYLPAWGKPFFYKYDLASQAWISLPDAPATISNGADMRDINGILYITRGAASTSFYTFNIAQNSWQIPTEGLFGSLYRGTDYYPFGYGANIRKGDGNNFYIFRGNYDNLFVRYNSDTGDVTTLARPPAGFYIGSAMAYDSVNNKIYAIPSQYEQKLLVYDIATDVWSEVTTDPPLALTGSGASMVYDGSRYIYLGRGGGNTNFYKYDTQSAAGSRWSTLAVAPGSLSYGSQLVYNGGYIYAARGNNTVSFYRYTVSSNTWSDPAVADLPTGQLVYNDGFLTDEGNGMLFLCRGGNVVGCFEYSISANTWTATANAPANIYTGGAAAGNGTDRILVIPGNNNANTYQDGLYAYIPQTSTSSFAQSGSYISKTYDLGETYKFANITVNYASATNNTLTVETRSSSDGQTWGSWAAASEQKANGVTYAYKVNSTPARYMQVQFILTSSDRIYSGSFSSYYINYYSDITSPINPTSLSAYATATQSASISTNTWYNYGFPYFSWPVAESAGGATDTSIGSGVTGYYVYFGTNASADPATAGTLQTSTGYTTSGLVSGNTYYLLLKTVDDAGNISPTSWTPFVYKYDSDLPINPTTVVASPAGYSATNSFNFSWSGATDSASGIFDYCYKIGTSAETCGVKQASISALLAYQTGTNTFYVRTRDAAGNKASSYVNASYYYASTAPSAPENLTVTPSSNSVNSFAFAWQPPSLYFGSQSNLRYYYSINALPTSQNVNQIGLTNTYLTADAYATLPGDNVFYVVAKDEAGNIDYHSYASVTFTANTSAPGISQNVDIADISVKSLQSWKLALSWEAPLASGSGVSTYKIYGSTVTGADCSTNFNNFNYLASTTGKSYVDSDLVQTDHYYCVRACDSTSNCSAVSSTINMYPTGKWMIAPIMTASPSATILTKSSTISWATSRNANSFVKYGTSSGNYGDEVGSSDQVTNHIIKLTGLNPGTTYYYQVLWTDEDGNQASSSEETFSTNPAPFISGVKITNISLYSAYVNFTVSNSTSVNVQYGETTDYGLEKTVSTSTSSTVQTVVVDNLTDGTVYHLRLIGEDEEGNIFSGDDYTFQTLPVPKITAFKIQQVEGLPTATLNLVWDSNALITSVVTYYPTGSPGLAKDQIVLKYTAKHSMLLTNLTDNSTYTVLVKGKDVADNEADYAPQQIKTAIDLRPPAIVNLNVETSVIGSGQQAKAQIVVSWDTDEPATSQVVYAEGTGTTYSQSTQEDSNLTTNHVVTMTGLTPAKIYHLQVVSKDKSANVAHSIDTVAITPNSTDSALNIVINNLAKTFGFLKGLGISQ